MTKTDFHIHHQQVMGISGLLDRTLQCNAQSQSITQAQKPQNKHSTLQIHFGKTRALTLASIMATEMTLKIWM